MYQTRLADVETNLINSANQVQKEGELELGENNE
jgi:hypothetical protein